MRKNEWEKEREKKKKKWTQIYIKETDCATVQIIWGRSKAEKNQKEKKLIRFIFISLNHNGLMKWNAISVNRRDSWLTTMEKHTRGRPTRKGATEHNEPEERQGNGINI